MFNLCLLCGIRELKTVVCFQRETDTGGAYREKLFVEDDADTTVNEPRDVVFSLVANIKISLQVGRHEEVKDPNFEIKI